MAADSDHGQALARLLAKDAISDVLTRFARGADTADLDMMRSVYWPDATDDHGNFSGNAMEFAEFAIEVVRNFRTTMHLLTNVSIAFAGEDQADVECYFYAYHEQRVIEPGEPATVIVVGGRYLDRFERRGEEWRILRRVVTMDWNEQRPLVALAPGGGEQFGTRPAR